MDPFVWDPAKEAENIRKHGVSLEIVRLLDWDNVVIKPDERFEYGEVRLLVMGRMEGKPYYAVVAPRDGTLRVLSARRMHEKEAKHHGI